MTNAWGLMTTKACELVGGKLKQFLSLSHTYGAFVMNSTRNPCQSHVDIQWLIQRDNCMRKWNCFKVRISACEKCIESSLRVKTNWNKQQLFHIFSKCFNTACLKLLYFPICPTQSLACPNEFLDLPNKSYYASLKSSMGLKVLNCRTCGNIQTRADDASSCVIF